MVLPVAGRRRQMLMVQLMMVGVRGDGAAAEDILDEERRPAGGSSVLAWLSLLLLAGRLHLFSFDATLQLRRVHAPWLHPRPGVLAKIARSRSRRQVLADNPRFFAPGEMARGDPSCSRVFTTRYREEGNLTLGNRSLFSRRIGDHSGPIWAQLI